jgi:hypothetical protein
MTFDPTRSRYYIYEHHNLDVNGGRDMLAVHVTPVVLAKLLPYRKQTHE